MLEKSNYRKKIKGMILAAGTDTIDKRNRWLKEKRERRMLIAKRKNTKQQFECADGREGRKEKIKKEIQTVKDETASARCKCNLSYSVWISILSDMEISLSAIFEWNI